MIRVKHKFRGFIVGIPFICLGRWHSEDISAGNSKLLCVLQVSFANLCKRVSPQTVVTDLSQYLPGFYGSRRGTSTLCIINCRIENRGKCQNSLHKMS